MLGIYIGNNLYVESVHLVVARKRVFNGREKKKKEDLAMLKNQAEKDKAIKLKRKPSGTLIEERLHFSLFLKV